MKYLLPGSIALAMFVSVMIGGGMLYIDDKARGVHEGYLVTPITKFELVAGLNIAGAIKAIMAGIVITILGSLLSGLGSIFALQNLLYVFLMIVVTSLAFNTMMFLMMVRVEDPLVPRHLRHSEYAAVLPQRRHLSHQGISGVAALDCLHRSLQLCRARLQSAAAERCRLHRYPHGHRVSDIDGRHHDHDRNRALQAHVVGSSEMGGKVSSRPTASAGVEGPAFPAGF